MSRRALCIEAHIVAGCRGVGNLLTQENLLVSVQGLNHQIEQFFDFSREDVLFFLFFFSSRRRHTRLQGDWSSDVCSSDLGRSDLNVLLIADEGAPEIVDAVMAICERVCAPLGERLDGAATLERWLDTRYLTGKSAEGFKKGPGFVADTLEMCGPWKDLPAIYEEVVAALQARSEEHTSELQSPCNLVCRL